jgi:hypothetical protein
MQPKLRDVDKETLTTKLAYQEVIALVTTKKDEHVTRLDVVDTRISLIPQPPNGTRLQTQ